jgi:hypothetical protein
MHHTVAVAAGHPTYESAVQLLATECWLPVVAPDPGRIVSAIQILEVMAAEAQARAGGNAVRKQAT